MTLKKEKDGSYSLQTTEDNTHHQNECWYFRAEPNFPGYYYIEHCIYEDQKLAMWDWWMLGSYISFGVLSKNRDNTMLFKPEKVSGDFYRLRSYKYPNFKLGKKGEDNSLIWMSDGPNTDD